VRSRKNGSHSGKDVEETHTSQVNRNISAIAAFRGDASPPGLLLDRRIKVTDGERVELFPFESYGCSVKMRASSAGFTMSVPLKDWCHIPRAESC